MPITVPHLPSFQSKLNFLKESVHEVMGSLNFTRVKYLSNNTLENSIKNIIFLSRIMCKSICKTAILYCNRALFFLAAQRDKNMIQSSILIREFPNSRNTICDHPSLIHDAKTFTSRFFGYILTKCAINHWNFLIREFLS